jgi:hypothetical protein
MSYTAQFAALRALDGARRAEGESPALLGGLVRANANLGVLTDFHYTAAHKAYLARALLYAQRLTAAEPGSASSLWHRAYALALTGLHAAALADLAEADRKAAGAARPAWVGPIGPYCRFDLDALGRASGGQLGQLLTYLSLEYPMTKTLTGRAGAAVLQANPECFRVSEGLIAVMNIAMYQGDATLRPAVLVRMLRAQPGLPASVAAELPADGQEKVDDVKLLRTLEAAGGLERDQAEPAWSSLAWMLRDTRLVQLRREAEFLKMFLAVGVGGVQDFVTKSMPLLADHPYQAYFEYYALFSGDRQSKSNQALYRAIDLAELSPSWPWEFRNHAGRTNEERFSPGLKHLTEQHTDDTHNDLGPLFRNPFGGEKPALARRLLTVSPVNPLARASLVVEDWNNVRDEAAHWDHPAVLAERARVTGRNESAAKAVEIFKMYVKRSPDFWAYQSLAGYYKVQDRLDLWEETLEEALKVEAFGLEHARVKQMLARHYMDRKEWKKALPHAEAAAGSGASWAMNVLGRCYEGLGEWEKAEALARGITARYPNECLTWFFWCARTGRGDLQGSIKAGLDGFRSNKVKTDPLLLAIDAVFRKQPRQALDHVRTHTTKEPMVKMLIILLAEEVGQADVRDEAAAQLPADHWVGRLDGLFRAARDGRLDLKAADELLAKQKAMYQGPGAYFVGRFLELHGQAAAALPYYERCAADESGWSYLRVFARMALRAHGREPRLAGAEPKD